MPSYFLRTTGMSRGVTDGTSKKTACTWHRAYFRHDEATGLLLCVNECEDGLLWLSPPQAGTPPAQSWCCPQPVHASTAEAFAAALARCTA